MKIIGTKTVNGRKVNVWQYTEEEKAAMKARTDAHKAEIEAKKHKAK